jgi:hypothetical protein
MQRTFEVGDERWTVFAVVPAPNATVAPTLKWGWLCFETERIVRRLAPIPPAWLYVSAAELAEFLEVAGEPRSRNMEIITRVPADDARLGLSVDGVSRRPIPRAE